MKKIAAKQVAKKASQTVAKKVAQKTGEKIGSKAIQSGARNIPIKRPGTNISQWAEQGNSTYNKFNRAQNVRNNVTSNKKEETESNQTNKNQKENSESSTQQEETLEQKTQTSETNAKKRKDDNWYKAAMFCAIWKDLVEIGLNYLLLGWLVPIVSFFPTIALSAILFMSGKKSTTKIVMFLIGLFIDYLIVGVTILPITTIMVLLTFKANFKTIKQVSQKTVEKISTTFKSFIKLKE